jgi:uncharacterized protein YndB with AHSA1/START domain
VLPQNRKSGEEAMTFTRIRMQIVLSAEPERVFKALTDSNAVPVWFSEYAEIDLDKNQYDFWGKFTPGAPGREAGRHKVVEQIQGQTLAYRWRTGGNDTRVTFQLHPSDKGTILSLRQVPDGEEGSEGGVAEDFWFLSLENLRRYLDGKASDARIDFTNPMRGDIRHETEIDAPAHRVWQVLTDHDELNRWIATQANVQLELGGLHSLGWTSDGIDFSAAKIVDIVPDQKFSIEDEPGGLSTNPTVVTWEMKENNGKTWLTFTHSGFEADQDVSGLYTGWRNFVNWVRSVSEYGAAWYPPVAVLSPGAVAYPASMYSAQDQLVEELRETA